MAYSDKPTTSFLQKLGCFVYILFAGFVSIVGLISASMGHCAEDCENEGLHRVVAFPGLFIFFFILGLIIFFLMMRNNHKNNGEEE